MLEVDHSFLSHPTVTFGISKSWLNEVGDSNTTIRKVLFQLNIRLKVSNSSIVFSDAFGAPLILSKDNVVNFFGFGIGKTT